MSEHTTELERLARAFMREVYGEDKWREDDKEVAIAGVRAVLEALREPTLAMVFEARHDWHHNHGPESRTLHGENIYGIWQAMISAILEEPE